MYILSSEVVGMSACVDNAVVGNVTWNSSDFSERGVLRAEGVG